MPIEIQKLIGEVAARNHCRIEASDPIFAVSTINRLMLDEVVEGLIVRVGAAITAFETSARAVDAHAGKGAGRRDPHLNLGVEGGSRA
jgi:hypothetical protein